MNYDKIIATAAQEMRASGIRKFFDIAAEMKDCISLGVGEPDFKTPWAVRGRSAPHLLYHRPRRIVKRKMKKSCTNFLSQNRRFLCNFF